MRRCVGIWQNSLLNFHTWLVTCLLIRTVFQILNIQIICGPQSLLSNALSLRVKRPGREANRIPLYNAEVKNVWSYTSTLPIRLHGVVLGIKKEQGQLYPYLLQIIRTMNETNQTGWKSVGHVARTGETEIAFKISVV